MLPAMNLRRCLLLVLPAFLFGCAQAARVDNIALQPDHSPTETPFSQSIQVVHVEGGRSTNPLVASQISNETFLEALTQSLAAHGLLGDSPQYTLSASILSVRQAFVGLSMTSRAEVYYRLVDTQTDRVLIEKNMQTTGQAGVGDAMLGSTRQRITVERAAQESIRSLIQDLETYQDTGHE